MGKRKSRKAAQAPTRKVPKLDTTFNCPFCNNERSVSAKLCVAAAGGGGGPPNPRARAAPRAGPGCRRRGAGGGGRPARMNGCPWPQPAREPPEPSRRSPGNRPLTASGFGSGTTGTWT